MPARIATAISAVFSLGNRRNNALEERLTLRRNLGMSFVSIGDIGFVKLTLCFSVRLFLS